MLSANLLFLKSDHAIILTKQILCARELNPNLAQLLLISIYIQSQYDFRILALKDEDSNSLPVDMAGRPGCL